jgi:acyl-coenzyme A synthetase/AMP-(fatty) acid ligase
MPSLDLIARPDSDCFARTGAANVSIAALKGDIMAVADGLADARYLINRCEDRYWFTVTFMAAAVRGQITLLPGQRGDDALDVLHAQLSRTREITDQAHPRDQQIGGTPGQQGTGRVPALSADQIIARAYTSGSTGTPEAHDKPWGLFCQGRATHGAQLDLNDSPSGLIATVPSWHMYGLEWALLLPTAQPLTLYCGPTFFPGDVAKALAHFSARNQPAALISTPVHLQALRKATAQPGRAARIVSATAPLAQPLALATETQLQGRLLEIYGCSEIGSLASRAPAREETWRFFPEFALAHRGKALEVRAAALPEPVVLADQFAAAPQGRFRLVGRTTDLVKIAGKRDSLSRLNSALGDIEGSKTASSMTRKPLACRPAVVWGPWPSRQGSARPA